MESIFIENIEGRRHYRGQYWNRAGDREGAESTWSQGSIRK